MTRRIFSLLVLSASLLSAMPANAEPFDCARNKCGLLTLENNPDLVVGTVEAVATQAQMKTVFQWARRHGYWKDLPADGHGYPDFVQLLSITVHSPSGNRSVTVLMTREEFDASSLAHGALVRYSPHDAAHDAITYPDPAKQSYWVLVGCVAQLCAPEDKECRPRYRPGRFARHSGAQLNVDTGQPLRNGVEIDPQTLLPKKNEEKSAATSSGV